MYFWKRAPNVFQSVKRRSRWGGGWTSWQRTNQRLSPWNALYLYLFFFFTMFDRWTELKLHVFDLFFFNLTDGFVCQNASQQEVGRGAVSVMQRVTIICNNQSREEDTHTLTQTRWIKDSQLHDWVTLSRDNNWFYSRREERKTAWVLFIAAEQTTGCQFTTQTSRRCQSASSSSTSSSFSSPSSFSPSLSPSPPSSLLKSRQRKTREAGGK